MFTRRRRRFFVENFVENFDASSVDSFALSRATAEVATSEVARFQRLVNAFELVVRVELDDELALALVV